MIPCKNAIFCSYIPAWKAAIHSCNATRFWLTADPEEPFILHGADWLNPQQRRQEIQQMLASLVELRRFSLSALFHAEVYLLFVLMKQAVTGIFSGGSQVFMISSVYKWLLGLLCPKRSFRVLVCKNVGKLYNPSIFMLYYVFFL